MLRSKPFHAFVFGLATLLALLGVWIVTGDQIPALRGPAPYPVSWMWSYAPLDLGTSRVWSWLGALALYVVVAIVLLWRLQRQQLRIGWLLAWATLAMIGLPILQTLTREQSLRDTLIFRTYSPVLNGYFVAPAQMKDPVAALSDYLTVMPTFFSDRPQTHPPGLYLFYLVVNGFFERQADFSHWFSTIARTWAVEGRDWIGLPDGLVTSAFFSACLQLLLVALSPLAAYAWASQLTYRNGDQRSQTVASWLAVALPLIAPTSAFFLQWDINYLPPTLFAWALALRADRQDQQDEMDGTMFWRGTRWLRWLWPGLLLSLLTWLSFGNSVTAAMIGLHLLLRQQRFRLRLLAGGAVMLVGVLLPWLLAYWAWRMNGIAVMQLAIRRHYEVVTSSRDYNVWLWMNGVDLALWLGPAILVLGLLASIVLWVRWRTNRDLAALAFSFWSLLLLLDLSGTSRAEVGRLWIFLMPYPLFLALLYAENLFYRALLLGLMALWMGGVGYAIAAIVT
ncbi:MAG: hypothetical protein U0175_13125 [Caldilineaceae bacterium]